MGAFINMCSATKAWSRTLKSTYLSQWDPGRGGALIRMDHSMDLNALFSVGTGGLGYPSLVWSLLYVFICCICVALVYMYCAAACRVYSYITEHMCGENGVPTPTYIRVSVQRVSCWLLISNVVTLFTLWYHSMSFLLTRGEEERYATKKSNTAQITWSECNIVARTYVHKYSWLCFGQKSFYAGVLCYATSACWNSCTQQRTIGARNLVCSARGGLLWLCTVYCVLHMYLCIYIMCRRIMEIAILLEERRTRI